MRGKIQLSHTFEEIISIENLLSAWREFIVDKKGRLDVRLFQKQLMDNIMLLHYDLRNYTYKHSEYQAFNICDPKPRNIHKASVRDRLLHHAIYRILYPFFDKTFISSSFSCRINKGTHRAIKYFQISVNKTSKNNTRTCWILKCDIKKFFANIDHRILLQVLSEYIPDKSIMWLLGRIINSFEARPDVGLPLGNLTSQLFVNVYMNKLDQFVKHKLKAKYYVRYADDFVLLSDNKQWLERMLLEIKYFLSENLRLDLHPNKVTISTIHSGIDYLGWVNFPHHKVIRTNTRRRMIKRLNDNPSPQSIASYLGLLGHGNTHKIRKVIRKRFNLEDK